MAKHPYLVFRLEGPLQSWGERSKWDYRDTADFPSKSGVTGMLACAMGITRNDPEIGEMCQKLSMAVRADRLGHRLTDFHTVQAEKLLNAEGKPRRSNTITSYRTYLQDASFLVALGGPEELLRKIKDCLSAPRWQIYLGRKGCVPSVPVTGNWCDEYETLEELMQRYPLIERSDKEEILYQIDSVDGSGFLRNDIRIASADRKFTRRMAVVKRITGEEMESNVSF